MNALKLQNLRDQTTQQSERQPYDVVRQTLKGVELDSSQHVELKDYIDVGAGVATPVRTCSWCPWGLQPRGCDPRELRLEPVPALADPGMYPRVVLEARFTCKDFPANVTHTINEDERTKITRRINAILAGRYRTLETSCPSPPTRSDARQMQGRSGSKLINDSVPDTIDERVLNKAGKKIKQLNAFHMTENNNIVINSAKGIGCSVVNIGSGDIIEVREHLILGLIWQIIRRGLVGKIDIKLHPELYRLLEEDETLEQFLRLPPEQILLRWFNYHLKNAKWDRRVTNFSTDVKDGENYTVLMNRLAPDVCSRGPLQTTDLLQRAEEVLTNRRKLDCRKFLTPTSLVAGNPKLNLAFVANCSILVLDLILSLKRRSSRGRDFDAEGERKARVFTLWLNSLDVQPAVNSLFDDLRDGSADITDGQRTLTLGLVWQLMRRDITRTFSALTQRLGKRKITDAEMIRWANDMSKSGEQLRQLRPGHPGRSDEEAYANAKLSISIARKMGTTVWLVPEDICKCALAWSPPSSVRSWPRMRRCNDDPCLRLRFYLSTVPTVFY
ncbi:hypothetical protein N7526_011155 [Penicillium atrosanguineum]|nr:hypothetical protein N7526_011155 [Penicillium atrosanguineum]